MSLDLQKNIPVFNLKEIITASVVLFAVIDIIGNISLIICLREKVGHIQSEKASIIAAFIMIIFLFYKKMKRVRDLFVLMHIIENIDIIFFINYTRIIYII